jgi:hypothetical protein
VQVDVVAVGLQSAQPVAERGRALERRGPVKVGNREECRAYLLGVTEPQSVFDFRRPGRRNVMN